MFPTAVCAAVRCARARALSLFFPPFSLARLLYTCACVQRYTMGGGDTGVVVQQRKFYSSLGRQNESQKRTMPSINFPAGQARSGDDEKESRVGPGSYSMRSSMGRQVLSTHKQVISAKFQKGKRPDPKATDNVTGPSDYDQAKMNHALAVHISTVTRAPTIKFGTQRARPDYGFASVTRNVGALELVPAIGRQVLSHSRSAPRVLMASRVKVVGEKSAEGPGPCYRLPSATGRQVESLRRSQAGVAFGVAGRPELNDTTSFDTPGPGAYKNEGAIGSQTLSTRRSQPSASMAGREEFGSMIQNLSTVKNEPGPGQYPVHKVQYRINGHTNAPVVSMGTRWWNDVGKDGGASGPGPGSYKLPQASGKQVESQKHSSTGIRFNKSLQRPKLAMGGADDVDFPLLPSTVGKQVLSTIRSQPEINFAKDKQRPDYSKGGTSFIPGPGTYKYDVTKCPVYRRSPVCSISSRTKFGSVYG